MAHPSRYSKKLYSFDQPMRVQVRQGSPAERAYFKKSRLPGSTLPKPKAIAPGVDPSPLDDLIFHGGKTVAEMEFQNVFLGVESDWAAGDIASIDQAIKLAMQDRRLNNVIVQYFPNKSLSCDPRPRLVLGEPKASQLDEPDVQAQVIALFDAGKIENSSLGSTIFNLVLAPGTVLRLGSSTSLNGLGGYHGSVHVNRGGKNLTLYYSVNVFSQRLSPTRENGIAVFKQPWKNVVATLYHELNEFRTDADVNDAIQNGNNDFLGWTSRSGAECGDQPIFAASSLGLVFKEVAATNSTKRIPVQFMFSNAAHGAEGPIAQPHA